MPDSWHLHEAMPEVPGGHARRATVPGIVHCQDRALILLGGHIEGVTESLWGAMEGAKVWGGSVLMETFTMVSFTISPWAEEYARRPPGGAEAGAGDGEVHEEGLEDGGLEVGGGLEVCGGLEVGEGLEVGGAGVVSTVVTEVMVVSITSSSSSSTLEVEGRVVSSW